MIPSPVIDNCPYRVSSSAPYPDPAAMVPPVCRTLRDVNRAARLDGFENSIQDLWKSIVPSS